MLVGGLLGQVCTFAADERLPATESLAFRLALIRALRGHGQALAEVSARAAAFKCHTTLRSLLLRGAHALCTHKASHRPH